MVHPAPPISVASRKPAFTGWDALAMLLVLGFLVFLAKAGQGILAPLPGPEAAGVTLDRGRLPEYAAKSTLRMLAAMALSLLFTFTYATWAAKSRRAGLVLLPILDILQSVPILGFISITVVFFMSLAPGRVLGAEFAAVFAIFTSQAWNMAFSFYQSLRTVPEELGEAARNFGLSPWMRFWRLEVPFALPQLIWNMMMSMSGGWFFVVASEAISVGDTTVTLPGVGSFIALAIERRDFAAIGAAIGVMLVVILVYDQLLFRPLVAWADRFRYEQEGGVVPPRSWMLTMLRRSRLVGWLADRATAAYRAAAAWFPRPAARPAPPPRPANAMTERLWLAAVASVAAGVLIYIARFLSSAIMPAEVGRAAILGLVTMVRVVVLIALASAVWVPVGILVGLRPTLARLVQPVAQFLAAFPANLLFPIAVSAIVTFRLDPDIWLSPLMIFGTQWYILFNVIAGASTIPGELRDVGTNLGIRGWLWWRKVALPAVFPFYVTGAITASGGSWNASIVAEMVSWGERQVEAHGLGAYIAAATKAGDYQRIVLGITVMSAFVVLINRLVWRPLYRFAEMKYRLG